MADIKIDAGDAKLGYYVKGILEEYNADVTQEMQEIAKDCAKEAVEQLKTAGDFGGKKYRKAWTSEPFASGRYAKSVVVHLKKPFYRIGHLLEFGHAKRNGGRVRAFEHIKPVADRMTKEYEERIMEKI